jgi:hypothetical protein
VEPAHNSPKQVPARARRDSIVCMPDRRRHRGPHPGDAERFGETHLPALREAAADLGFLLDRGYANTAALKLVGDRFALDARQRLLLMRCSCPTTTAAARQQKRVDARALVGRVLWIDGFNVLTTIEAALAGGVLLRGRDGCTRDMASMHGTWRRVDETSTAAVLVGGVLAEVGVAKARVLLDRPVSNAGRFALLLRGLGSQRAWNWQVELSDSPDRELAATTEVIATADGPLLDRSGAWFDLASEVLARRLPGAPVLHLH